MPFDNIGRPGPGRGAGERAINLPPAVLWLIGINVAVHLLRSLLGDETDQSLVMQLGLVPAAYSAPDHDLFSLIVVFCTGLGLYALMASIAPAIMSELFPTELRATGIGAWYNLTVACFGGTAPLVITALSEAGHPLWFFWYVAIGAVIAFVVILTTLKETNGTELT